MRRARGICPVVAASSACTCTCPSSIVQLTCWPWEAFVAGPMYFARGGRTALGHWADNWSEHKCSDV
ncbi:hypothetical protein PF005_g17591 [Phytophthora fragariae]|uniref:Uncharacterized protein n=1 Tax=Phytophthora fragariae TaxID=53985 RepID=A0A6A3SZM2_9STRA|nr:hypothetical protein PF003_g30853 [Phytophthora fragariae]KAE8931188.1 hypothetical protein PF009_g18741 [Phytophthora fragariae]KAE8995129.1 hypothetical protein PF011_g16456 [Phytophthora fragariae]KAE9094439.1 hypothetical protein PF010_g17108 [Phytophthora fragariae]KAE9095252.1 hypothetical protein PF007_g17444 [Phytophthora fragariae]